MENETIIALHGINRVFGVDLKPEMLTPINTNDSGSYRSEKENFLVIEPLTRNISVPDHDIGERISFTAKLSVGFPILERNENVQKLAFRCDITPYMTSYVFERKSSDPFWQRENMDFMPIVEEIFLKTNLGRSFSGSGKVSLLKRRSMELKSTLSVASVLSPLKKRHALTDKEVTVLVDFINGYSVTYSDSKNGLSKIKGLKVNTPIEIYSGYLPKLWTLKDLAAWVLVTERWPTFTEARKLQHEKQLKMNKPMANLETGRT